MIEKELISVKGEIKELRADLGEIITKIDSIEKRSYDDDIAFAKELADVRHRLDFLERQIKILNQEGRG
ncbi:MAG: hypothetical protein WCT32_05360 [Patescibacteria group bacterium]|jgi:predicted  nucleic acid-binding Zn-ribbon protein